MRSETFPSLFAPVVRRAGVTASLALLAHADVCAEPPAVVANFIEAHCANCHDDLTREAKLDLTSLSVDPTSPKNLATWIKVYDRTAVGEMPPKTKPRPEAEALHAFLGTLGAVIGEAEQTRVAAAGRAVARRLNRYEFENTVKDLLDLPTLGLRSMLPEDSMLHGYNRVGEALDMSHVQVARYLEAAELALREAVATRVAPPPTTTKRYYTWQQRQFVKRVGPDLRRTHPVVGYDVQYDLVDRRRPGVGPQQTRAPDLAAASRPERREQEAVVKVMSTYEPNYIRWDQFTAPVTGRYRLKFSGYTVWMSPDFRTASRGRRTEPISIYAWTPKRQRWLAAFDFRPDVSEHEIEVWLRQGETILPDATRLVRSRPPDFKNPLLEADGMPGVAYQWMEATGPLLDAWPPAGHQLLFGDLPMTPAQTDPAAEDLGGLPGHVRVTPRAEAADVPRLMRGFVARAYRRPLEAGDVEPFVEIVQQARGMGHDFTDAMIAGYAAVLASPGFLYQQARPGALSDSAVAERLSYFLWNSPPDDRLRQQAASGRLRDPAVLRAEVDRMLADPRVDRFVEAFLDYWLDLRKMPDASADANLYPEYALDDYLVESMAKEPQHFFLDLLRHDRPARSVVHSDFVIVNERLARLYDLPGVVGTEFRRVELPPGSVRGGLMTQAAVLKVTANGTTTSPVLRGVWINERIRGIHTPPPPTGVPAVESDTRGATTIREQLAKHRTQPACSACHARIDPPGLALENFDVMGAWRTRYRSLGAGEPVLGVGYNGQEFEFKLAQLVDPSGQLPDGRAFADVRELKRLLLRDERQLARNLAHQLVVYATGAPVRFSDRPRVEALLNRIAPSGYGVRTLIHELVADDLFLKK
jgi:hypothetical protein